MAISQGSPEWLEQRRGKVTASRIADIMAKTKAYAFGNEVKIERGKDGTQAKTFPTGSCVKWEFTQAAFNDIGCPTEDDCEECCKKC